MPARVTLKYQCTCCCTTFLASVVVNELPIENEAQYWRPQCTVCLADRKRFISHGAVDLRPEATE